MKVILNQRQKQTLLCLVLSTLSSWVVCLTIDSYIIFLFLHPTLFGIALTYSNKGYIKHSTNATAFVTIFSLLILEMFQYFFGLVIIPVVHLGLTYLVLTYIVLNTHNNSRLTFRDFIAGLFLLSLSVYITLVESNPQLGGFAVKYWQYFATQLLTGLYIISLLKSNAGTDVVDGFPISNPKEPIIREDKEVGSFALTGAIVVLLVIFLIFLYLIYQLDGIEFPD